MRTRPAETLTRLTRVFSMGATVTYLLAGIASARDGSTPLAWALAAGVLLHLNTHVANDVADLPLDATDPRRAPDPLVRGRVPAELALLLAVATLPVVFAVTRDPAASVALAGAVVLVGLYNLAGKSLRVPFAADAVQGAGFGALVVAGAYAAGGATAATWWAAGLVAAYDAMVNGVHGAVRDVANDTARGATTTAALLGARVDGGRVFLPRSLVAYGAALHLATAGARRTDDRSNRPGAAIAGACWRVRQTDAIS